jgi:hypothetical protein
MWVLTLQSYNKQLPQRVHPTVKYNTRQSHKFPPFQSIELTNNQRVDPSLLHIDLLAVTRIVRTIGK